MGHAIHHTKEPNASFFLTQIFEYPEKITIAGNNNRFVILVFETHHLECHTRIHISFARTIISTATWDQKHFVADLGHLFILLYPFRFIAYSSKYESPLHLVTALKIGVKRRI